jgi:hypothetical protein
VGESRWELECPTGSRAGEGGEVGNFQARGLEVERVGGGVEPDGDDSNRDLQARRGDENRTRRRR